MENSVGPKFKPGDKVGIRCPNCKGYDFEGKLLPYSKIKKLKERNGIVIKLELLNIILNSMEKLGTDGHGILICKNCSYTSLPRELLDYI